MQVVYLSSVQHRQVSGLSQASFGYFSCPRFRDASISLTYLTWPFAEAFAGIRSPPFAESAKPRNRIELRRAIWSKRLMSLSEILILVAHLRAQSCEGCEANMWFGDFVSVESTPWSMALEFQEFVWICASWPVSLVLHYDRVSGIDPSSVMSSPHKNI